METSFFKLFPLNLPITVTSTKRNVKACRLADRAIAIFYRALADGQSGSIYIMLLRRCFSCFLRPSCHRTSMAFLWLEHNHHFHSQSSYFTWFLYLRPEYNGWCFSLLASFFFSYHWFQLLDLFLDQFVYSISWLNSFEIKYQTRDWNNWHRVTGWLFSRYHHCSFFSFFSGKRSSLPVNLLPRCSIVPSKFSSIAENSPLLPLIGA